jgi:hypothetical protein
MQWHHYSIPREVLPFPFVAVILFLHQVNFTHSITVFSPLRDAQGMDNLFDLSGDIKSNDQYVRALTTHLTGLLPPDELWRTACGN